MSIIRSRSQEGFFPEQRNPIPLITESIRSPLKPHPIVANIHSMQIKPDPDPDISTEIQSSEDRKAPGIHRAYTKNAIDPSKSDLETTVYGSNGQLISREVAGYTLIYAKNSKIAAIATPDNTIILDKDENPSSILVDDYFTRYDLDAYAMKDSNVTALLENVGENF